MTPPPDQGSKIARALHVCSPDGSLRGVRIFTSAVMGSFVEFLTPRVRVARGLSTNNAITQRTMVKPAPRKATMKHATTTHGIR
jgi:hypothetical protein